MSGKLTLTLRSATQCGAYNNPADFVLDVITGEEAKKALAPSCAPIAAARKPRHRVAVPVNEPFPTHGD